MRYFVNHVLRAGQPNQEREALIIEDGIVKTQKQHTDVPNDDDVEIDGSCFILVPSFANPHLHLGETIFRGKCDGLDLKSYLDVSHSFFENRKNAEDEEKLHSLTGYITLAEALRTGTGCIGCSRGYDEIKAIGMQAVSGLPLIRIEKLKKYCENFQSLFRQYYQRNDSRIQAGIFVQGLKTVTTDDLLLVKKIQEEFKNVRVMIHLSETVDDVEYCVKKYGVKPVQYINQLGLLNDRCICVHLTYVDDDEMRLIYETGAHPVFCPAAILKLRSGIPPILKFYENKISFSLATDGLAVSGSASMLEQAKLASLITGGLVPSEVLLDSITKNAYKALGFEAGGKITEGSRANLALFSYTPTALFPEGNNISQLIHNFASFTCKYLWIDGKLIVSNGAIVGFDEHEITSQCVSVLNQFLNR